MKITRKRCFKSKRIVGIWVKKLECMSVKHHPLERIGLCAMALVTHHGRAKMLHGHANLMASPGFNQHLD